MDEYMDTLSKEILRLYRKGNGFHNYNLSQLEVITNHDRRSLCSAIALLRSLNYLVIDPSYAAIHPDEVKSLDDTIALDTPLRITKYCKAALEKVESFDKRSQINEIRAWLTFAVSVATLILTIISVLSQLLRG